MDWFGLHIANYHKVQPHGHQLHAVFFFSSQQLVRQQRRPEAAMLSTKTSFSASLHITSRPSPMGLLTLIYQLPSSPLYIM